MRLIPLLALLCLASTLFAQPSIGYIQLIPTIIPDNAETDCQALVTHPSAKELSVKYYVWDSNGSRKSPKFAGNASCIGESFALGKVCYAGYFSPAKLSGLVTCRFEASDGEATIEKSAYAARVCRDNCPENCGDGMCDNGESTINCAQDCLAYRLEISVLSPAYGEKLGRGEKALFKVFVSEKSEPEKGAAVTASGFFGAIELHDDGEHGDNSSSDGIYANEAMIPPGADGTSLIEFRVIARGKEEVEYIAVEAVSSLKVSGSVGGTYKLGDTISIIANATSSGNPSEGEAFLEVYSPSGKLVHEEKKNFTGGGFLFSYRSGFADELGIWKTKMKVVDKNGDTGTHSGQFLLMRVAPESYLDVEHVGPLTGAYKRGATVSVTVRVRKNGQPVSGAKVVFLSPDRQAVEMRELEGVVYGSPYTIRQSDPLGQWTIATMASLKAGEETLEGGSSFVVSVLPSRLQIELVRPEKSEFGVGENVEVVARARYADGEPVNASKATLTVSGNRLPMQGTGNGYYVAYYSTGASQEGELMFSLDMEDQYANAGSKGGVILVRGTSVWYAIDQNKVIIIPCLIAGLLAGAVSFRKFIMQTRRYGLLHRKEEVMGLQKKLQEGYLKLGTVDRKTFYEMSDKYDAELERIEHELGSGANG